MTLFFLSHSHFAGKQFSIILELLGDNKLNTLTAEERRSLAMLKDNKAHSPYVARYEDLPVINELMILCMIVRSAYALLV